jgi:hypothetical protein
MFYHGAQAAILIYEHATGYWRTRPVIDNVMMIGRGLRHLAQLTGNAGIKKLLYDAGPVCIWTLANGGLNNQRSGLFGYGCAVSPS